MAEHERHSDEVEFDIGCDACHDRVSEKIRARVRKALLAEGLSEEQVDEFFVDMDRMIAEWKERRPQAP